MRTRSLLFLLSLLALLALAPRTAQAQTYSYWNLYGDRWWRVMADVRNPLDGKTYVSSQSTVPVPHNAYYHNDLYHSDANGLAPHFYSMVGSLQRYDRGYAYWRYFQDEHRSGWYPSNYGVEYSYYGWWNPPSSYYWDYVSISPTGTWNLCDAIAEATDQTIGYVSISVAERVYYKTRPM